MKICDYLELYNGAAKGDFQSQLALCEYFMREKKFKEATKWLTETALSESCKNYEMTQEAESLKTLLIDRYELHEYAVDFLDKTGFYFDEADIEILKKSLVKFVISRSENSQQRLLLEKAEK